MSRRIGINKRCCRNTRLRKDRCWRRKWLTNCEWAYSRHLGLVLALTLLNWLDHLQVAEKKDLQILLYVWNHFVYIVVGRESALGKGSRFTHAEKLQFAKVCVWILLYCCTKCSHICFGYSLQDDLLTVDEAPRVETEEVGWFAFRLSDHPVIWAYLFSVQRSFVCGVCLLLIGLCVLCLSIDTPFHIGCLYV